MEFSTKLRNLRIQRGLTQMELAEKLGTSQSSITSWESNRREPDFATIRKLASFFNVPMVALLPSDDNVDEDYINVVTESLHANPKLRLLFDRTKNFSEKDLDAMIVIADTIVRRQE